MNKYDVAGLLQTYAEKIGKAPSKTSAELMISDLRRELPRRVEWDCEWKETDDE